MLQSLPLKVIQYWEKYLLRVRATTNSSTLTVMGNDEDEDDDDADDDNDNGGDGEDNYDDGNEDKLCHFVNRVKNLPLFSYKTISID